MPGYIYYIKFTQQGINNLKALPERIKQGKANVEKAGAKMVGIWATFGRYDLVAIVDAPNDYTAAGIALAGCSDGLWTTETARALSEDEFAQVVQRLPS